MKLLRTTRRLFRKRRIRQIIYSLIVLLLLVNFWLLLTYVTENKEKLIYNKNIKVFLPAYRSVREFSKTAVNCLYLFKMNNNVKIPAYKLEIKPEDLKKLNENLPDAYSAGVIAGTDLLTAEFKETVPAKFYYKNKEYQVKVRYRGGNANHWTRSKRSWQIMFDKDDLFLGWREIKLIIPDDRSYFAEFLNNYRAEKLGLFFPQADYVRLEINNENHGVYYQIEDWTVEFLEKNQKPADANLYATDEVNYRYLPPMSVFADIKYWKKHTNDKIFSFDNYAELDFLINLLKQENFYELAPNIIDLDNFYKWQAVSILAGSNHQGDGGNIRAYFNNSKGKFEFIPWDAVIKSYPADGLTNLLADKIYQNPEYLLARNKMLWEYVSDKSNLEDDLKFYDDIYNNLKSAFYADWKKHDSNLIFNNKVAEIRSQFEDNFKDTKKLFSQDDSKIIIYYNTDQDILKIDFYIDNFSGLNLQSVSWPLIGADQALLYYDSNQDGLITGVDDLLSRSEITGERKEFTEINYFLYDNSQFINNGENEYTKHTMLIKLTHDIDIKDIKFNFLNAVTDKEIKIDNIIIIDDTTFSYFSKINVTPPDFVQENKIFRLQNADIILPAGNYYIQNNIIIPKDSKLIIMPGTVINFAEGKSLISYSPIVAQGTVFRPIIFRPADANKPWGTLGTVNCGDQQNKFKNIKITGGGSAYLNGILFSGMLSAYHCDTEIANSVIEKSYSDDGLNIKYARAVITNSQFINNSADAIDLDYASGEISGNFFNGNGNDSIDLSGAEVKVQNNEILNSGDKGISIGEKSKNLIIFNNIIEDNKIGIETKDGSTPMIINNIITNNKTGLNAYRKKEIYFSGGNPKVYNSLIWGNDEQVVEDEFSKTEIYYSNIQDGFKGEGNFSEKPEVVNGRGSREVLQTELGIEVDSAPVGLYEVLRSTNYYEYTNKY